MTSMCNQYRGFVSFRLGESDQFRHVAVQKGRVTILSGTDRSHKAIRSEIMILNGSHSVPPALFVPAAD